MKCENYKVERAFLCVKPTPLMSLIYNFEKTFTCFYGTSASFLKLEISSSHLMQVHGKQETDFMLQEIHTSLERHK